MVGLHSQGGDDALMKVIVELYAGAERFIATIKKLAVVAHLA